MFFSSSITTIHSVYISTLLYSGDSNKPFYLFISLSFVQEYNRDKLAQSNRILDQLYGSQDSSHLRPTSSRIDQDQEPVSRLQSPTTYVFDLQTESQQKLCRK